MRAVGFSISAEGTRYSVFVWWNVQHPGWRLVVGGLAVGSRAGCWCGPAAEGGALLRGKLTQRSRSRSKTRKGKPAHLHEFGSFLSAKRPFGHATQKNTGWMAGWLDVLVMSELLQYNRGRDTAMKHRVPTPNVVHSSGRGVDATQSVRSIVFGFRCWRRISSAFSKTLHSTHRMLCRSTFGGTLSRDKTRRRTMAVQWLFYARKWCDTQQKASVNLDPGPAAEAMAESLARFVHCARERGLPST